MTPPSPRMNLNLTVCIDLDCDLQADCGTETEKLSALRAAAVKSDGGLDFVGSSSSGEGDSAWISGRKQTGAFISPDLSRTRCLFLYVDNNVVQNVFDQ